MPDRMPALFVGHGNPMNALAKNAYTEGWAAIGQSLPRPQAVLAISAHWYRPGSAVTMNTVPRTIHDFGGFPEELYRVSYPVPGDPRLARHVRELLAPLPVSLDESWGLDHGTWAVLCHVFPKADIPIVQLRIDAAQPSPFHFGTGRALAPLRQEGVLVVASGNVVHNLSAYAWDNPKAGPLDWASRFENRARELLLAEADAALIAYERLGHDARLAIPTPEHYLPLLYLLGLREKGEPVHFPVQGIEGGSISMLTVQIG